ncbi:type II toxin-antitoxin system Phd/YefM family antitoxin [Nonomuraea polychroma]|uniref:type II toxin-antitoxin system Phd/YefM family antitoxin n=1 Tax=Nonomuraea polychroma TaxID=46176 RepID=UPI003D907630
MATDASGIAQARSRLGTLVSRAVHGHQPTTIRRSSSERAVLISEQDYEELLRARHELEAGRVAEATAAHERGDREMCPPWRALTIPSARLATSSSGQHADSVPGGVLHHSRKISVSTTLSTA